MRQIKLSIAIICIFIGIVILLRYSWYSLPAIELTPQRPSTTETKRDGEMRHTPLNAIYPDGNKGNIIDTAGCQIPVATVNYKNYPTKRSRKKVTCGKRAVFLRKVDGYKVQATIENRTLTTYLKDKSSNYACCYQFIKLKNRSIHYDRKKLQYSACTKFYHESIIILESDFISIKCFENNSTPSHIFYDDMYAFAKKIDKHKSKIPPCKVKYNVLMLGMDSMSLSRTLQTLPRVSAHFKNNLWVNYKGYHKVADNTFPNLMAVLTGKNIESIAETCNKNMDKCNKYIIWDEFNEDGYVTAYGEDFIQLPDTFTREYKFFKAPTDHFMRPFFLKGETRRKPLVCTGKLTSGQQILNYALDFANTYKNKSFFGVFWINSFSHESMSRPQDADKIIENFFNQLVYTNVMINTFVIFFSDHGIRFGKIRLAVESYHEERLPTLFMAVPQHFKENSPLKYKALALNQHKLVTPYDLHATLSDVKKISRCENFTIAAPDGCQNCHSLFNTISNNRTCQSVNISDKWCSCHPLHPLPLQDPEGMRTVEVVIKHIMTTVGSIKTKKCWGCLNPSLSKVHRIHYYYDRDRINLYYVVAITMQPGNTSYEATTFSQGAVHSIVGSLSIISGYRGLGHCAIKHRDRLFCVCQHKEKCT